MNILITNDDGIDAVGIRYLTEWACSLGDVTVVAPKTEQSGASNAIDFINPTEICEVSFLPGVTAYSMTSTPADCVRFATLGLKKHYDLVLSGINRGVNVGEDIVYSGTVGAIFEAVKQGSPAAIAFSAFPDGQAEAAQQLDRVYRYITDRGLFRENPLYNVNIPKAPVGIRMTYQGSQYFTDAFERREGNTYVQVGHPLPDVCPHDLCRDTVAVHRDLISITPLLHTRTNMDVFRKFAEQE